LTENRTILRRFQENGLARRKRKLHSHHRSRKLDKRRALPGTPAGSLSSDPLASTTEIKVMAYDGRNVHEQVVSSMSEILAIKARFRNLWVDVTGLGTISRLEELAKELGLHPLAMEDVTNVHQRAKVDSFGETLFVVVRMTEDDPNFESEQLTFFLLDGIVVSFQERPGDCWEMLRNRLRQKKGRAFESGVDYLLYALIDAAIDSYFPAIEQISETVDEIDERIAQRRSGEQLHQIHLLRQHLLGLRRAIRPHREMLNSLLRDESARIHPETRVHLRDTYDHVVQLIDSIDTYRELTSDLRDYYLSSINNTMNEVIKVLTIISTIFIPLSFIAGVYGMNFEGNSPWNMPELHWYYGYPFALGLMLTVALSLLVYFRWRRWV
jgi:magnesium transporter